MALNAPPAGGKRWTIEKIRQGGFINAQAWIAWSFLKLAKLSVTHREPMG